MSLDSLPYFGGKSMELDTLYSTRNASYRLKADVT